MNQSKPEHGKFTFFLDSKEIVTDQPSLKGREIKAMGRIPGEYQLFLETEGDEPDEAIADTQRVELEGRTKHFYAVPPATFGR